MIGKCLWKLLIAESNHNRPKALQMKRDMIKSFTRAIECLPNKKDGKREPILEPHYKLVSVVHKLVMKGQISVRISKDTTIYQKYQLTSSLERGRTQDFAS